MYPNYPNQTPYPNNQAMPPYPGAMPPYPNQGMPMQQQPQYPGGAFPPMPNQFENVQQQQFYQPQMAGYPPPQQQQMPGGYPQQQMMPEGYQQQQFYQPQMAGFPPQQQQQQFGGGYQQQQMPGGYGQQQAAAIPQPRPTIVTPPNFDAANDAAILRKAMKGFGTDEDAIINVLCRRPSHQRNEIVKAYKTAYGKDLINDITKETSNNFQRLCIALCTPRIHFYCQELYEAMKGKGTDEDALIEIMCGGLSNQEIQIITHEYKRLYGETLEEALKSETSHSFRRLLVSCSTGNRDETMVTDINSAINDAQMLKEAGVGCWGTDESEFNRILCLRNFEQLKLIAQEYQKLTGNTLEKDIKREFSGDVEDGMVSILRCALNRSLFFAKCIHKAIAGFGTDDRALIRLVVTRSEIDMQDIKEEYQRKYNESVKSAIKGDTSGHYKHGLYALIGENRS